MAVNSTDEDKRMRKKETHGWFFYKLKEIVSHTWLILVGASVSGMHKSAREFGARP